MYGAEWPLIKHHFCVFTVFIMKFCTHSVPVCIVLVFLLLTPLQCSGIQMYWIDEAKRAQLMSQASFNSELRDSISVFRVSAQDQQILCNL